MPSEKNKGYVSCNDNIYEEGADAEAFSWKDIGQKRGQSQLEDVPFHKEDMDYNDVVTTDSIRGTETAAAKAAAIQRNNSNSAATGTPNEHAKTVEEEQKKYEDLLYEYTTFLEIHLEVEEEAEQARKDYNECLLEIRRLESEAKESKGAPIGNAHVCPSSIATDSTLGTDDAPAKNVATNPGWNASVPTNKPVATTDDSTSIPGIDNAVAKEAGTEYKKDGANNIGIIIGNLVNGYPMRYSPTYHPSHTPANHAATRAPPPPNTDASHTLYDSAPTNAPEKSPTTSKQFPRDSYSFLVRNGPENKREWPTRKLYFFLFGLIPFLFQMLFLVLLLRGAVDEKRGMVGENGNPDSERNGARAFWDASRIVRWAQVTSLAAYLIFPDATMKDVVSAVEMFPRNSMVRSGDPVGCMRVSCLLRGIQGILAMFATLLLILTSNTVVGIILNFTVINYISNLDDYAFNLARSGQFGLTLQEESEKIANSDLPSCMHRDAASKRVCNMIVVGSASVLFFGIMFFVIIAQKSDNMLVTETLRVEFREGTGLNEYSGCFGLNKHLRWAQRRVYDSVDESVRNTSFGYCREQRQWILFKGSENNLDPCDANDEDRELARSSKTDAFDISALFDSSWVSSRNTPLDLYFFDGGNETELIEQCNLSLGDGICDQSFNQFRYQYDGGDCCAPTCTGSKCGREGLTSVFGNPNSSGVGFPDCKDPDMVPITIHLSDIKSSRDPEFVEIPWYVENGTEWRTTAPVNPYFALECNGKNVLTAYIDESMVNNSETVMVEDGANCALVVRNTTRAANPTIETNDPTLFINYTIFHGANSETVNRKIEILSQRSRVKETEKFERIPECYLRKLENHTDIVAIYTTSEPSNEAIDWLLEDDPQISQCEDDDFTERFALVSTMFAMNGMSDLSASANFKRQDQCTWPTIVCRAGQVDTMKLDTAASKGFIPSTIALLTSLNELQLHENQITSLPTEIGLMSSLRYLYLGNNQIASLPTEVGLMSSLRDLYLGNNQIASLPTEIGLMSSLQTISLNDNQLTSLPTEIGLLSSLQDLVLNGNQFASIPTEIGLMSSLQYLYLDDNNITYIRTEIGTMSSLQYLYLDYNQITSLPTEIGRIISLQMLSFNNNDIEYLPKQIGLLSSLQYLSLSNNQISSLPTEIGLLSSLQTFHLNDNQIASLPTEIGLMSSLQHLSPNYNQITSLPTEIGMLATLEDLYLNDNNITSIPTEIGLMSSLQILYLNYNQIVFLPTEIGLITGLQDLYLNYNQITSIPTEIGLMSSLQILYLSSNQIRALPTEIWPVSSLQYIYLDDNNIVNEELLATLCAAYSTTCSFARNNYL